MIFASRFFFKRRTLGAAACIATWLFSCHVAAQPDAGQILNEQQQLRTRPIERVPSPLQERQELVTPAADAVKVSIRSIRIAGAPAMAEEGELQALVADAIGRELDYAGLQQLADRVTQFLRSKGYLLAFAYLPAQDLDHGQLEIAVQLGRLDGKRESDIDLRAQGVRTKPDILRDTVAVAVFKDGGEGALKTEHLERGLLLLNDLPGIKARSTLEPGTIPGSSRLVILAEEGPLFQANFLADNYGSRYTGRARAHAQLLVNSPSRLGDQASIAVTHSKGVDQANLAYRVPVGSHGLQVGGSLGHLAYRIGEELAVLESKGTASTARLNATYPLLRSRKRSLWTTLAYDYRRLTDQLLQVRVQDKDIHAATIGLNGNVQHASGASFFNASVTHGRLDLSRNAAHMNADQASSRSHGPYTKAQLGIGHLEQVSERLTISGALSGQVAADNLDSSEKFILGGPTGIRAYPTGEASGDSGWMVNLELRYELSPLPGTRGLRLLGFVDAGGVRLHRNPWTGAVTNMSNANRYELAGAGIGVDISLPAGITARASLAAPIGNNPGRNIAGNDSNGARESYRFWLQISTAY